MRIKTNVLDIARQHRTNDPFEIASRLGITVLYESLGNTLGYFNTYKRIKIIHINNCLEALVQRFVCAHELGHAILHPNLNTPFLRSHTLYSVDRIEREANRFAVELLIPDELIREHATTVRDVAVLCGVPQEIAKLKKI